MVVLSFCEWKDQQVKKDSKAYGCLYFRERDWYWRAYGLYVLKQEKMNDPTQFWS